MKTREIILASLIIVILMIGVCVKATESVTGKSIDNAARESITEKVNDFFLQQVELTDDMNGTFANVYFVVDTNGNISFTRVDYQDYEKANKMEKAVNKLKIEPTNLRKGTYYIKIWFKVR